MLTLGLFVLTSMVKIIILKIFCKFQIIPIPTHTCSNHVQSNSESHPYLPILVQSKFRAILSQTGSDLDNLLLDDFFRDAIDTDQESWSKVVANAVKLGVPTPCFSTALAFYDGYRYRCPYDIGLRETKWQQFTWEKSLCGENWCVTRLRENWALSSIWARFSLIFGLQMTKGVD